MVFVQKDMIPVHYAALNDKEEVVELFFNVKPDTMTQVNAVGSFFLFVVVVVVVIVVVVVDECANYFASIKYLLFCLFLSGGTKRVTHRLLKWKYQSCKEAGEARLCQMFS